MRRRPYMTVQAERTTEQVSAELGENYKKILELMQRQTELFTELNELLAIESEK
jgi:hypothetical protein